MGTVQVARVTTRETTTSILGQDSTQLILPVEANKSYFVKVYAYGNNGNGIKYALKAPVGSTLEGTGFLEYFSGSGGSTRVEITALETYPVLAMTSSGSPAHITAVINVGSTAGSITFQFGSTVDVTTGYLYAGSVMYVTETDVL